MAKSTPLKLTCNKVRTLTCPAGERSISYTDIMGNLIIVISPRSKIWRYRFRFNGGNPETITLGKWPNMSYEEARAKVVEFERARSEGRHPRSILARPRRATTVADVLQHHLLTLKPDNRKGVTNLYREILKDHGATAVTDFTRYVAKRWIEDNYEHRKGAARSLIRNLTAAFNRAIDSISGLAVPPGYENPTSKISKHISWLVEHKPGSLAVAWEDREWEQVMAAIQHGYADPDTHVTGPMCLELLLHTGARPSEIQSLRWDEIEDFHTEGKNFRIAVKDRHKTWAKTDRPRQIFFSEEAMAVLDKAAAYRNQTGYNGPYVFPSRRSQKNQKVGYVSRLTALAHRLGKAVGFDFKPYNFRSAYINHAVQTLGYGKLSVISENVGHTEVATTLKYYHRQRVSDRAEAAEAVGRAFKKLSTATTVSGLYSAPFTGASSQNPAFAPDLQS
ncbi:tyrosine-type recombinase/integrase [Microvirga splendida]|uniref:Integrase family protein n=1 Tax=Microvirga splendida TaxID=2795727 RepID=A0ABS0XVH3_9HYPH|nr:integrase family protein [Microvirga splendida]MBJ6124030.1 integrase family protein [Microvirga splendida]